MLRWQAQILSTIRVPHSEGLPLQLTGWELALIANKFFVYAGVSASVGGPLTVLLLRDSEILFQSIRRYALSAGSIGFVASILGFYLQVGFLAEEGILGILNPLYREILWSSSVGDSTFARIAGFAMVVFSLLIATHRWQAAGTFVGAVRNLIAASTYLLACAWLLYSFTPVGHTAVLHWTWCLTLALHVFLVACWLGSLWPLFLTCKLLPPDQIYSVMHKFGRMASVFVALLIAGGAAVALQLFGSPIELISTNYGRAFMAKLMFVVGMLFLALRHKKRLVPALLRSQEGASRLKTSIGFEILIGVAVLIVTAFLTTSVGPEHGI